MSFLLVDWHCPSPKCPSPAFLQRGLLLPALRAETPGAIRKTKEVRLKDFTAQPHHFQPSETSGAGPLSFRSRVILLYWGVVEKGLTMNMVRGPDCPTAFLHHVCFVLSLLLNNRRDSKVIQAGKSPNAIFINYRIEKNSKNREERMLGDRKKKENKQENHKMGGKIVFLVTHR